MVLVNFVIWTTFEEALVHVPDLIRVFFLRFPLRFFKDLLNYKLRKRVYLAKYRRDETSLDAGVVPSLVKDRLLLKSIDLI